MSDPVVSRFPKDTPEDEVKKYIKQQTDPNGGGAKSCNYKRDANTQEWVVSCVWPDLDDVK